MVYRTGNSLAKLGSIAAALCIAAAASATNSSYALTDSTTSDRASVPVPAANVPQFDSSLMYGQMDLLKFRDWIEQMPPSELEGYFDTIIVDIPTRRMAAYWKGEAKSAAKLLQEAHDRGITLEIRKRSISRLQMIATSNSLMNRKGSVRGKDVTAVVGDDYSFDGLVVEGVYNKDSSSLRATPVDEAAYLKSLGDQLRSLADGAPVKVRPISHKPRLFTGRNDDYSPFNAGGYMISWGSGMSCSTGFAVYHNGVPRTTTARHCGYGDYHARVGGASYGSTEAFSIDGGAARVLSSYGDSLMFDGPVTQSGYTKHVTGSVNVTSGAEVCTSGGNSGVHCTIKVGNMWYLYDDGYGAVYMSRGYQQSYGIAAMAGDSGGPVFVPQSDGTSVLAAGMIQAGANPPLWGYQCGTATDIQNECSTDVLFTLEWRILATQGLQLVTS